MEQENTNALETAKRLNQQAIIRHLEKSLSIVEELLEEEDVELIESDFKKYFLPVISKEVEPNEENIQRFLHNLYNATGSYYRGLKIVDDNTREELFVFPPIMLEVDDDSPIAKNINYFKLITMYKTIAETNTSEADNLIKGLAASADSFIKPDKEKLKKDANGVMKMLQRYNL
jgi:hypothetical protein